MFKFLIILFNFCIGVFAVSRVFYCNFDESGNLSNQCGGVEASSSLLELTSEVEIIGTRNPVIHVTDVTSIIGPTVESSESCKIPFENNGLNYYFCYENTCETQTGVIRNCVIGNFLLLKTPLDGSKFFAFFDIKDAVILSSPGRHRITFYSFIHCRALDCEPANDQIVMKIKEEGEADFNKEIYRVGFQDGRIRDDRWNLETVYFETETDRIKIRFELLRQTAVTNAQGFLAIDEISIYSDEDVDTTEDSEESTTGAPTTEDSTATTSAVVELTTEMSTNTFSSTDFETTTEETTPIVDGMTPLTAEISTDTTPSYTFSSIDFETTTITTDEPTPVIIELTSLTTEMSTDTFSAVTVVDSTTASITQESSYSSLNPIDPTTTIESTSTPTEEPLTQTTETVSTSSHSEVSETNETWTHQSPIALSSTSTTTTTKQPSNSSSSNLAAIIGGTIAGAVLLSTIIIIVLYLYLHLKKKPQIGTASPIQAGGYDTNNNEFETATAIV